MPIHHSNPYSIKNWLLIHYIARIYGVVKVGKIPTENTKIIANDPNTNLINMVGRCEVSRFDLSGARGATGVYLDGSQSGGKGSFSAISECFITYNHSSISAFITSSNKGIEIIKYSGNML